MSQLSDKAQKAKDKKAAIGEDVDINAFNTPNKDTEYVADVSTIDDSDKKRMLDIGVTLDDLSERSGTYIQKNNTSIHSSIKQDGIEVMPISQAAERYDWLKDYLWKAVAVDTDKYTAHVELNKAEGYFIRALPGVKTDYPVQSCLYLSGENSVQDVHNVIIAEEGSELHIITGCATPHQNTRGLHLGVSEFYIKKGAKVTFTMIHNWSKEAVVRPRTGTIIEEDGLFMSNYVIMNPVSSIQTNPICRCVGKNSTARFNSVIVSKPGTHMDIGSRVYLEGEGSKTEIISRAITTGGDIIARGLIEGNKEGTKGHLECRGLIMSGNGKIHAVPELVGAVSDSDLSHEAAVGKIAEEEVEYLMARGLTKDEATSAIVRGFLNVDIEGLPPILNEEIHKAIKSSDEEGM